MRHWLQFLFLLLAASAFAHAPERTMFLPKSHQLDSEAGPWPSDTVDPAYVNRVRSGLLIEQPGAAAGLVRKFFLDGFGRTNRIIDVFNGSNYATNQFLYDKLGQITNLVDAANNKIEYAYNDLGQVIAMADPNLGLWRYARDFAGRLKDQTDAKGQRTRFTYDTTLGRPRFRYVYDAAGTLAYTSMFTYDSGSGGFTVYKGQLASVSDTTGTAKPALLATMTATRNSDADGAASQW